MNIKAYKKRISGMKLGSQIATIKNNIAQKESRKVCLESEFDSVAADIVTLQRMLDELETIEAKKVIGEMK